MYEFLAEISAQFDTTWLAGTALISCLAALVGIGFFQVALRASADRKTLWLGIAGIAAGTSAWSTHFVGVLAGESPHFEALESVLALASWGLAVGGSVAVFRLAGAAHTGFGRARAGLLLGLVIGVTHSIGLENGGYKILSLASPDDIAALVLTSLFAAAALGVAGGRRIALRWPASALLLALSGMALHLAGAGYPVVDPQEQLASTHLIVAQGLSWLVAFGIGAVLISVYAAVEAAGGRSRESAEQLQLALDTMPIGVAVFDPQDRVTAWNARYAGQGGALSSLMRQGQTYGSMLKACLRAGVYPDALGREDAWLQERLEQRSEERDAEHFDGQRWMRTQERRTRDGGLVSITADITELKQNALALAEAVDNAEAANRAKDAFLANMSHELRTPLNGVVGTAQLLAASPLEASQRELVQIIESSGHLLTRLVSDVLDLAQIEAGRLQIVRTRFNPERLFRETAALWTAEAEARDLPILVDIGEEAQPDVEGDPLRLRQVLNNLASNAFKFTAQGGIAFRLDRDPRAPDLLRFTVVDSGIGFLPEQADRLFDRFVQADDTIVRRFGGTGLGLAISRELAERMGGTLTAKGRPGEGASFRLSLPLPALADMAPAVTPADEESAPSLSPALRVLLAEDHPVNRRVVTLLLNQIGASVTMAEDGEQATTAFAADAYDVVLMDMQMPVMDGLTATRAIRSLERAEGRARTPVIMLTANVTAEHVAAALAAGADEHLGKPIGARDLLAAIARVQDGGLAAAA